MKRAQEQTGLYQIEIQASYGGNTQTITDSIEVLQSIPITIDRQEFAHRLTREMPIDARINITAHEDVSGDILEYIPEGIEIASSSAGFSFQEIMTTNAPVSGSTTPRDEITLGLPYEGIYSALLGFGDPLQDSSLKDLYRKNKLHGHDGIDFDLSNGTPVLAVDDGVVQLAGRGDYGVTVVLQHKWGRSYYGHLESTGLVPQQKVLKGEKIGRSGNSGLTSGAYLHFGIKLTQNDPSNGFYGKIDPKPYLTGKNILSGYRTRALVWRINLSKGQSTTLSYRIRPESNVSTVYQFGPISITRGEQQGTLRDPNGSGGQLVFQERSTWQYIFSTSTMYPEQHQANQIQVPSRDEPKQN